MDTNFENTIQGSWEKIKGKLKQQWAKITDDEVLRMKGNYEELSGSLQKNYGYTKEQARQEIQGFLQKHHLMK